MQWRTWILGAVALLVFDAVLVFGVRVYRSRQPAEHFSLGEKADTLSASSRDARFSSPAVAPMKTACINGGVWAYDARQMEWVKLPLPIRCDAKTGRVLPRSSGANLTQ